MPEWVNWFFDGIGTEILSLIIGALGGGYVGFRVGKRKSKFEQIQEAGTGAEQRQQGKNHLKSNDGSKSKDSKSRFRQIQKAGDNSKQTQIGDQDNV